MGKGWGRGVAVAALVLVAGAQGLAGAAGEVYRTAEACWEAHQTECTQVKNGWVPAEDLASGNVVGEEDQVDQENLDRQRMSMPTNVYGSEEHPVVAVDMNQVMFPDVQPYLDPEIGRVRVPVRFVSEQMGATVEWDDSTQTVTISQERLRIQLRVDDSVVLVNESPVEIDAPPRLVDPGRVMVPLRFISESFGALVDWVGTESPDPRNQAWGKYQVWIWTDNGYWGKYTIHDRLFVHGGWFYRGSGR